MKTIAFMIGIIPTFFNVIFVTINKAKNVYIFLIIQAILGIIGDFVLIPNLSIFWFKFVEISVVSIVLFVPSYIFDSIRSISFFTLSSVHILFRTSSSNPDWYMYFSKFDSTNLYVPD